jgi:hypothetical protein
MCKAYITNAIRHRFDTDLRTIRGDFGRSIKNEHVNLFWMSNGTVSSYSSVKGFEYHKVTCRIAYT